MNAISYSLFGYGQGDPQDFRGYMRGFGVNLRMARILYPGWKVCVSIDEQTFEGQYKEYFWYHSQNKGADLRVYPRQALCINMLNRLRPIFEPSGSYDRVICRDTDSLLNWKERQAVAYWEKHGRICHAMTDSISHTVALMGGMVGFMSFEFRQAMEVNTFGELMLEYQSGINFERKGADQDFLNQFVLPKVHTSMTEHYFLGLPQSFRGDCHNSVGEVLELPEYTRETYALAFHIGAAGFQCDNTVKFLREHEQPQETAYFEYIEKKFPEVFYWHA